MVVMLIQRCAKPHKEAEFLEAYRKEAPSKNPDFIGETLTKLSAEDLPEPMRSLATAFSCGEGVTYLNIARWKSWESFEQQFKPETGFFDNGIESSPRLRAVFEVIEERPGDVQKNSGQSET